ncbi:MAG: hypothetical protein QOC81_3810 [Thermoanaerobaculia bacterium]|jgi:hypothetical protein|nr:hypothetical protein [Thermoanaerobaculia bacterium]
MKTALFVLLAIAICFTVYAASDSRNGVWTAELNTDGSTLQMTLFRGNHESHLGMGRGMNNVMGFELSLASLTGLTTADIKSAAANVQFTMSRPAGSISFEGRFASGNGAGNFKFTPSEPFVREMASLGYTAFKDDELLCFATTDFTPQTVRDLRALGYQPTQKQIIEAAIFKIDANAIREFKRFGYPNLSFRELVNFRVGNVNAAFVEGMRELGYTDISANKLANLAILGVTPAYVRELRAAGLKDLTPRDAEQLRIGNITPAKISEYKRLGYNLSPHELGEFGIQGVTPATIEELNALGYGKLTAHQLVEMRIFGVTPDYIRKIEANGYKAVPVEKLIKLRMSGADEFVTGKK